MSGRSKCVRSENANSSHDESTEAMRRGDFGAKDRREVDARFAVIAVNRKLNRAADPYVLRARTDKGRD